ncbi:hypothetical protein FACS189476_04630 [Spirochaetia bacterium]|nr:hypothetical protein FACS189476_04630 [Spirochaetia bacterium]
MKITEIAGDNPQFAASLLSCFRDMGYKGASGNGPLDLFVYVIDPPPCGESAYDDLLQAYQSSALRLLETVSGALPRLEKGTGRRLCFVTGLSSSINLAGEIEGGPERIISAACNMAIKTLFNRLRPEGYTFRVYGVKNFNSGGECPAIADYCVWNRSLEEESPVHSDENRLVMRDKSEKEYPW